MLNSVDYSHPIAVSDNSYNYSNGFDSITMLGVESEITDWLKFTAQASYKYGNSINDYFQPAKYTSREISGTEDGQIHTERQIALN